MKETKKISITRDIKGVTLFDENYEKLEVSNLQAQSDGGVIVYFANLFNDKVTVAKIKACFQEVPYTTKKEYLDAITLKLVKLCDSKYIADLLTIDAYNKSTTVLKSVQNILRNTLDDLILYSHTFCDVIYKALKKDDRYIGGDRKIMYGSIFHHLGNFNNEITFGIGTGLGDDKMVFFDVYTLGSSRAAVKLDFAFAAKNNVLIKKCKNCDKYFIPISRSDEIYCDNIFTNGKTCKEIGYINKLNKDELLRLYRTIYKTQNARKQRNISNISHIDEKFQEWVKTAKEQLTRCQSGEINIDEFKQIISSKDWIN